MTPEARKKEIRELTYNMINELPGYMKELTEKLLKSGAIDFEDDLGGRMLWPKAIICAIAEEVRFQYDAKGTSFDKRLKKEIKNLKHFV